MIFRYYTQFDVNLFFTNIILDIILEILLILIVLYILNRLYFKQEIKRLQGERSYVLNLITWAAFFLLISLGHSLRIIVSFITFNNTIPDSSLAIFEKVATLLIFSAFLIKILYIENAINNLKYYKGYFFSITISLILIFLVFIDLQSIREIGAIQIIFLIMTILGYLILPILYLYLTFKTVGRSRNNAAKVSIGTLVLGIGALFQTDNMVEFLGISELLDSVIEMAYVIGPIIVILASILIFMSFRE